MQTFGHTVAPRLAASSAAAGNKLRLIDEYVGRVISETSAASLAHMRSLGGWREPGQTPDFEEFTVVFDGDYAAKAAEVIQEVSI
jgi:hypothetical protein